ncbi:MAG TPA: helix-turn-helix domain-containing protein, partial [Niallia sp.]|nr:helix-turn-helix domain-containing protein [Niallia sp.]
FAQKLEEICHQINIYFKGLDVYACIGGTYHYTSISSSLLESERSMQLLKRMKKKKRVSIYEDLGVYQLFFHMKDSDLIQLQNQWIGKILLYDEKYGTDLIKTLDVLFKNKMNATDAAKELFIHRNTLNIRLNRIEKITDKNLKDPDTLNCLLFGVLIHHYLKRMQINN